MRKIAPFLALLLTLNGLPALASPLPDLGDSSQAFLSPQESEKIGRAVRLAAYKEGAIMEDRAIQSYIDQLGYRLVSKNTQSGQAHFSFMVLNDPAINAAAWPGGVIGIHSGLWLTAESESELASVLAHEIAHISQSHLARQLEAQKVGNLASIGGAALGILAGASGNMQAAGALINSGMGLSLQRQLAFSRDFEREADRVGIQLLESSGFDPAAMGRFFERLDKASRLSDQAAFDFLRTHPVTTERIADAQSHLFQGTYRHYPSRLDFLLLRERVRVLQNHARESRQFYQKTLAEKRFLSEQAHYYGLAFASYLDKKPQEAFAALQAARRFGDHPLFVQLEGEIALLQKDWALAEKLFQSGIQRFSRLPMFYEGLLQSRLARSMWKEGVALSRSTLHLFPQDPIFLNYLARFYGGMGALFEAHSATGEESLARLDIPNAIRHFELALQQKTGFDFYQRSAIEARLTLLKAEYDEVKSKSNK